MSKIQMSKPILSKDKCRITLNVKNPFVESPKMSKVDMSKHPKCVKKMIILKISAVICTQRGCRGWQPLDYPTNRPPKAGVQGVAAY